MTVAPAAHFIVILPWTNYLSAKVLKLLVETASLNDVDTEYFDTPLILASLRGMRLNQLNNN